MDDPLCWAFDEEKIYLRIGSDETLRRCAWEYGRIMVLAGPDLVAADFIPGIFGDGGQTAHGSVAVCGAGSASISAWIFCWSVSLISDWQVRAMLRWRACLSAGWFCRACSLIKEPVAFRKTGLEGKRIVAGDGETASEMVTSLSARSPQPCLICR